MPTRRKWEQSEIEYVKEHYPFDRTLDIANALGRTPDTVKYIAHSRGVYKDPEALSRIKSILSTGENSSQYKGYVSRRNGYILRFVPEHPYANSRGYIAEHRLVVEKHLGFILPKGFVVHHINGIKDDNRIENLAVMTAGAHSTLHGKLGRKQPKREQHYRYKDIDIDYIQKLHSEGHTIKEICENLGITKQTYYRRLKEKEQCKN